MKKIIRYLLIILVIAGVLLAWFIFGPATAFSEKSRYIYVRDNEDTKTQVLKQLDEGGLIYSPGIFKFLSNNLDVWKKLKPGRFEIKKSQSLFRIIRMLRNNTQAPSKLIINKLRTNEDLAKLIGKNFSTDSVAAMRFL